MPPTHNRVSLKYRLITDSNFHCGNGLRRGLTNRAIVFDREGFLYIPGSTLKGALRHRCEQVARLFGLSARSPHNVQAVLKEYTAPDIVACLFGSRVYSGELYFDDLHLCDNSDVQPGTEGEQSGIKEKKHEAEEKPIRVTERAFFTGYKALQTHERTQVNLSRRTGASLSERLFSSEYGQGGLRFDGMISGYIPYKPIDSTNPNIPTFPILLLLAGLLSLDRIGGSQSTGAGRCQTKILALIVDKQTYDVDVWLSEWLEWLGEWEQEGEA